MRLGLLCQGSRGDCQPYMALGLELERQGFEVVVFTNVTHTKFVRSFGLRCEGVFFDVQECLARKDVQDALSTGNFFKFSKEMQIAENEEFPKFFPRFWCCMSAFAPRVVIAGGTSYLPACLWCDAHEVPFVQAPLQLLLPNGKKAPMGMPKMPLEVLNRLSWRVLFHEVLKGMRKQRSLAEICMQGTPITISGQTVKLSEIGRSIHSLDDFYFEGFNPNTPYIIGISELISGGRTPEMGPLHHMTGWWILDASHQMARLKEGDENFGGADAEALASFLGSGPPPVYLGWGSMAAISAAHMTRLAVAALLKTGQRGIVMKGWAKLGPEHLDTAELSDYVADNVFFASTLPHEWLFPQCSCIVSHGGSGTTAATLRSGRPAVITPVFGDQFDFAESVQNLGVGVGTCQFQKVSAEQLASCILKCTSDESIMAKAAELGVRLVAENGVDNAVAILRAFVDGPMKSGEWLQEERRRCKARKSSSSPSLSDCMAWWQSCLPRPSWCCLPCVEDRPPSANERQI
ncbi:unnamed protein product [Polarella glacialis]|uniref:Erythromycin biosynthesis protein CIII-like C-terminal domain-containing protein n=1 Tax=Polarella glacialis TaxID=89957 RepID=A0A813F3M3_POLGL|nr:unnamed protein product [Polarella glacialis]CAE8607326.1 unnamed protein product [Polarella glacialis]CAE8650646.1 unnamed protein product [Polarella glacialis]